MCYYNNIERQTKSLQKTKRKGEFKMAQVTYNQAGYIGQSMSVRAREAYDAGEQPKSYWTKEAIIDEITSISNKFTEEQLNKYSRQTLKELFLQFAGWHHTGKYAKDTDFYKVSSSSVESMTIEQLNQREETNKAERKEKKNIKPQKGYIYWEEWEGKYSHYGRFVEHSDYCLIVNNQAYCWSGQRKNLNGCHILKVEKYDRAPKNTAKIYKSIAKNLPKKYR